MDEIKVKINIPNFENVINKKINQLKFIDIIVLLIYAFEKNCHDFVNPNSSDMQTYYIEFVDNMKHQNISGWPELLVKCNDYKKRFEIYCTTPFIKSQNVLTLLIRLIYIENFKKTWKQKNYDYHKILDSINIHVHSEHNEMNMCAKNLSFNELFTILEEHMIHYNKIYFDEFLFEYQLGSYILKHLN
jgi:hypothetical protein